MHDLTSLKNYVRKKGLGYFIHEPSDDDKKAFEGILFKNGYPNLSLLHILLA